MTKRYYSDDFRIFFLSNLSIAIFNLKMDPSKGVCHVSSVIFAHVPEAACCNHLSASIASYTHSFPPDGELGRSGRFCLAEAKARKREA